MFEQAEKTVVARELGGLDATDVSLCRERDQRRQGCLLSHLRIVLAMHQLQQLDGELDVAEAARTQLQLDVALIRGDVVGDALAHPLHRFDEILSRRTGPHQRCDRRGVPVAKFQVTGEGTRLEQRLELPTLRPAVVVGEMGFERAHQCAVLALWAEVGVHLPQHGLRGKLLDSARGLHGQAGSDFHGPVGAEVTGGLDHEDHVDVAHVVEFARTRLAHADDREARVGDIRAGESGGPPRDIEGRVECRSREVGEHPGDL